MITISLGFVQLSILLFVVTITDAYVQLPTILRIPGYIGCGFKIHHQQSTTTFSSTKTRLFEQQQTSTTTTTTLPADTHFLTSNVTSTTTTSTTTGETTENENDDDDEIDDYFTTALTIADDELIDELDESDDILLEDDDTTNVLTNNNELMSTEAKELLDAFAGAAKKVSQDLFVYFRMNAAQALTKSLPELQRNELLNRVVPNLNITNNDATSSSSSTTTKTDKNNLDDARSISEKISSYEIEQEKKDSEQEELMRKAEEAAMARIRTEIAIQQQQILLENYTQPTVHPILGPCLVDLGYKRLHSVPAKVLATIPVWQKQRIYRHDRAKQMAKDKLKTKYLGLPGVILLHEDLNTGKLSIVDGQHRVGMMQVLLQQMNKTKVTSNNTLLFESSSVLDLENIMVEVYPQTPPFVQELFLEVNKAEPVKLIDLPGVVKRKDRTIITNAVERLQGTYPEMFKPSQRCRQPHLNVDNVRDNIFASNMVMKHKLTTEKKLYDWLLQQNSMLEIQYNPSEGEYDNNQNIPQSALEKARKFNFYLGLESQWLYN